jgi:hypothetical protein
MNVITSLEDDAYSLNMDFQQKYTSLTEIDEITQMEINSMIDAFNERLRLLGLPKVKFQISKTNEGSVTASIDKLIIQKDEKSDEKEITIEQYLNGTF